MGWQLLTEPHPPYFQLHQLLSARLSFQSKKVKARHAAGCVWVGREALRLCWPIAPM